jgi:hypothetical protein
MPPSRARSQSVEQASGALIAQYHHEGLAGDRAIALQQSPGPITLGTALFGPGGQRLAGNLHRRPRARLAPHHLSRSAGRARHARAKATLLPGGYRLVVAAIWKILEAIDRAILAILPSPCWRHWRWAWAAPVLARYLRGKLAGIEDTASASGRSGHRATGPHGDEFDRWPPRSTPCSTGSPR